jgi:hypothetical protein
MIDLRENPPPPDWGVSIDAAAVDGLARRLVSHPFESASYDYEGTPAVDGEDWARFIVLGVSVVWRLWPPAGTRMWGVRDGERIVEDAPGLWICFDRHRESLDLEYVASGGLDASFFGGEGVLQDIPRRLDVLTAVAQAIIDRHGGSVLGMVEKTDGDALSLRDVLVDDIPAYLDRPASPLGTLPFDKLANLAVTMLAARLPITGTHRFPVFPDYMLPRHLRHEGILRYSDALTAAVDRGHLLESGSPEEMAIRWGTIFSAEMLRRSLVDAGNPVSTPDLDYWLWSEAVIGPNATAMGPHHLCVTEAY